MATSTRKSTELPYTEQEMHRQLLRIRLERDKLDQEEFSLRMHWGVVQAGYKRR